MGEVSLRKRVWGWMMFDWASQPYLTLILTFVFGPYFAEQMAAKQMAAGLGEAAARASAQATWGYCLTITGLLIACLAPVLGAVADSTGRRMPWIWFFSGCYVVGAAGLWIADPADFPTLAVLVFFGIGLIGMEFTTIFTNALLPTLGPSQEIGRISGSGWAWGYVGGVVALVIMLVFFAENGGGVTLIGSPPLFGLDPEAREGTRFVGPFSALWFVLAMIPFFLWVREPRGTGTGVKLGRGLRDLWATIRSLPRRRSLFAYLLSSMFYRDALNGIFTFGGIFALGVLGWSVIEVGVFGILAAISGALFAWIGGKADVRYGPKPVIIACILLLLTVCTLILTISRDSVLFIPVASDSALPDIAFYILGFWIGAAAGALQSASRTLMVRQSDEARMTEAFGLYALAGKATSFLAPAAIALATDLSGSARIGVSPLILLLLIGLVLLAWVKPEGERGSEAG